MLTAKSTENITTQEEFQQATSKALYFLPLYMLVPILIWLCFSSSGFHMDWRGFGLGALGWTIALLLRGPISAMVMKLPKEKAQKIVVGSSGPLEETVRIVLIALTGHTFSWALSVGQGWAAIEVVFVIINVLVIVSLAHRTDEKAMQAKEMLKAQGNLSASPLWGVFERVSASAFHIGCTLLVAKYPWSVVGLIPLHSFLNLSIVKLARSSIASAEFLAAGLGIAMLIAGILVF